MSYSRVNNCYLCTKKKECTDHVIIEEAINKIHSNNLDSGHLGSGTIILHCQNFDKLKLEV